MNKDNIHLYIISIVWASRFETGGKHPTDHRTATESLKNIIIPSTDCHVIKLWHVQIFLDCVGYQQYFHYKLVAMIIIHMYVLFSCMHHDQILNCK